MGLMEWFTVKTPAQRQKELIAYARWTFPHGMGQREKLLAILKELIPEERPDMAMTMFLLGREGYQGKDMEQHQELVAKGRRARLESAYWKLHSQLPRKLRKLISRYLALIEADDKVGSDLNYPTISQLQKAAAELEEIL